MSRRLKLNIEVDGVPYKLCYKCKSYNTLHQFHRNRSKPDGLGCICKACIIKGRIDSDKIRRDKIAYELRKLELESRGLTTYNKEYYEKNRIKIREQQKKYYRNKK